MCLDFWVYITMDKYTGGDVLVSVDVTDEEIELLKKCYREETDIESCKELENLIERVSGEAFAENESLLEEYEGDDVEEASCDEWSATVYIPDKIEEMVMEEEEE